MLIITFVGKVRVQGEPFFVLQKNRFVTPEEIEEKSTQKLFLSKDGMSRGIQSLYPIIIGQKGRFGELCLR